MGLSRASRGSAARISSYMGRGGTFVVVVYMQERDFNSFASNIIKLAVNETKWSTLLARTRALVLYISISGPKGYRDFRETGP